MTLDVVVTDKAGKPVSGLQQQDFTLIDNKQPLKISSFQAVQGAPADQPVEVILLIDEVNAGFSTVASLRDQVVKFLGRDGGKLAYPVSLGFVTDTGTTVGTSPTKDGNALIADLNDKETALRTINRSQGLYGADDRLNLSVRALEQLAQLEVTRPGRKLVVWISPGWPYLSGPGTDLTTKVKEGVFKTVVELLNGLRQARITLYAIDPLGMSDAGGFRTSEYEEFLKPVKQAGLVQLGHLALQVLAVQSGGRVFNSANDLAGEIATCVADVNAYYTLTVDGLPGDGPNEFHALTIKLDKSGLTPRTRAGYYAQPNNNF
jgi:VWFA-related protein